MFLFEHSLMLAILIFLYGIPALLISLFWFKEFNNIERWLIGFFLSFVGIGVLLSLMGYIMGGISFLTILLSWVVWILLIYIFSDRSIHIKLPDKEGWVLLGGLVLILLFTYMIRMSSFSPIYMEFDPYFYLEGVKMLLNQGVIPMYDDSAWYPYNQSSSHRSPPVVHYTLASWYYLYTQGGSVDRYLLSAVANYYPPLAAVGIALFFYFLGYALTKNRYIGLGLAVFASYTPIFIYKLMSGVFEFQPYNFFIFSMVAAFLALYSSYKSKDYLYGLSLGILGTMMGAIASPAIIIYLAIGLTFLAYKENIPMVLPFLATLIGGIWLWLYTGSTAKLKYALIMLIPATIPYVKEKYTELVKQWGVQKVWVALAILAAVAAFVVYTFFGSIIHSALIAAQYNNPLERTIQEQALAGSSLAIVGILGTDAGSVMSSDNPLVSLVGILYYLVSLPGLFLNLAISLAISLLQSLGLNTTWIEKELSAAYGLFALAIALLIWDLIKGKIDGPFVVASGAITLLIGLIKAKFQIYFVFGFLLMLSYLVARVRKWLPIKEKDILLGVLLVVFAGFGFTTNLSLSMASFVPTYGNSQAELQDFLQQLCTLDSQFCSITPDNIPITLQYNNQLCQYHLIQKYGEQLDTGKQLRIQVACNYMPDVWLDPMEWLYNSTPDDSRIISWWDYGHWINYWGERKAVIRNEHSVLKMILDTAYAFVMGNETTLIETMKQYGAQYALIDQEIVVGSSEVFGGKFFALNYLACAAANQTSVLYEPMESTCEWENLWEVIQVTDRVCDINGVRQGYVAVRRTYKGLTGNVEPALVESYCITPNDGTLNISRLTNRFALSLLAQTQPKILYVAYKLNETDPAKKLQKALWIPLGNNQYLALYLKDPMWFVDGQWVDGYEDRTTRFYDSVLYRGFVLEDLEGFAQTYNNGYVKIYLRENMDQG